MGKEPWKYSAPIEKIATENLRFRHKLLPYIYTMNRRTQKDGRAICEPMYYTYPKEENAYNIKNEYFFGTELIVAPITEHTNSEIGMASANVWLPDGRYTDIYNGRIYSGNRVVKMFRDISAIPVLAKEGAIIPMSDDKGNGWGCPENLKINIYRGTNSIDFYEDDGETGKYKNGDYSITKMSVKEEKDTITFTINGGKAFDFIPAKRKYTLEFKDVESFKDVSVMVNGLFTPVNAGKNYFTIENVNVADEIVVTLTGVVAKKNKPVKERALDCVIHLNGNNMKKVLTSTRLKSCKDEKDYKAFIRHTKAKSLRMCLDEAVFAMEE
jgi:hypothetical protein